MAVSLLPRRTVRLRLTLLYGGLFLISGAMLLAVTYLLVRHSVGGPVKGVQLAPGAAHGAGAAPSTAPPGLESLHVLSARAQQSVAEQKSSVLHQLLVQSAIALGLMAVVSIVLGWIVAGRILRPVRTIATAARSISATNLHERLALDGPDDELKDLGDTFDGLLGRLEASFRAQRQFVANASHELRTPLARQRALGQVALADPHADAQSLRTAHERILAAGVQQDRLIEALLTLAQGQTGIGRSDPVDLAAITDQVIVARRAEAAARGLELNIVLSPARTTGDPRLVERLVANLVDNALRHNTDGGRIEVTTATRDGHAAVSVTNTGAVVPPAAVDELFHPFRRLGSERTHPVDGLGLGLSIVQAIATAHDATLSVQPPATGGLHVVVRFP